MLFRNKEHLGIKFPCDLCEYIGRNQSELKKHKAKRHEGINLNGQLINFMLLRIAFFFKRGEIGKIVCSTSHSVSL